MKKYILVDEKEKWFDCFVAGHTIDSINNAIGYSFWVTHRASFAQVIYYEIRHLFSFLSENNFSL